MRKWLITGGCGFIGSSLIKRIRKQSPQDKIRVLDNLSVGSQEDLLEVTEFELFDEGNRTDLSNISLPCQLMVGDVTNEELTILATEDVDVIVHLAANTGVGPSVEEPRLDCTTNVIGTFNMLEAARVNDVPRFIFASSGAPVGEVEPPIHEELAAHPVSPYGASKLAGEGYCSAYFRTYAIETVALRFGNVYGPRSKNKSSVIAKFIKLALNGEPIEVYGDGSQTRDFIYIDDLLEAIVKSAQKTGVGGEIFQIATARETTVNEMVEILLSTVESLYAHSVDVTYSTPSFTEVMRNYSDTSKAWEKLAWRSTVELSDGIKNTVKWFQEKPSSSV